MIDEALTVGDQAFRKKSTARIESLLEKAGTLLLVSHSLDDVEAKTDRVIWIEQGRLRADGEPAVVIEKYRRFVG